MLVQGQRTCEAFTREFDVLTSRMREQPKDEGSKIESYLDGLNEQLRREVLFNPTTSKTWKKFDELKSFACMRDAQLTTLTTIPLRSMIC